MRPEALYILANEPLARKLAAAWPSNVEPTEDVEALFSEWAARSGVPMILVREVGARLLLNEIVTRDRGLHPLAVNYLNALVRKPFKRPTNRQAPGGAPGA